MTRTSTTLLALSLAVLLPLSVPSTAEEAPAGVAVYGSVKAPRTLTATSFSGYLPQSRLVKISGAAGRYRGTYEVEGVALRDLLEKAEVAKAADDGFDRLLDLAVVVTGRDGKRALFSWGEIYLAADPGAVLLVDRLRPFIPQHHDPVVGPLFATRSWLGPDVRAKLDVSGCASCHDGGKLGRIDVPRGFCLVPIRDRDGRRFVEDVVAIEVRQAGFPAPPGKDEQADLWVEAPSLVLPGGKAVPLTGKALKGVARLDGEDDTVGLGRGFRGRTRWGGVSLAALLRSTLPADVDPGLLYVVVTGSDGYRSLFSGGEILLSRLPENVVLVDTVDGKPLWRKAGRLRSFARDDFFHDRSVAALAEIRCVTAP